ncbi:MAG: hypothetical protein QOF02_3375 [Blastocatellia bacterium]|jgi:hypothetical protein|nr:hypothetical protein [Blastocatellia bacterium]
MNLLLSILLFFSMAGWAEPPRKEKRAQLGQEFTLKVGEQVAIREAGLTISFSTVAEDSRCPKGVDCIWAGNGRVVVQVSKGHRKAAAVELNTGIAPKEQRFQDYEIKLVSLNPYPQKDVNVKRSDYTATFIVSH